MNKTIIFISVLLLASFLYGQETKADSETVLSFYLTNGKYITLSRIEGSALQYQIRNTMGEVEFVFPNPDEPSATNYFVYNDLLDQGIFLLSFKNKHARYEIYENDFNDEIGINIYVDQEMYKMIGETSYLSQSLVLFAPSKLVYSERFVNVKYQSELNLSSFYEANEASTPPGVSTSSASNISPTSATLGGNVRDDGTSFILSEGIEYSTLSNFAGDTGMKVPHSNPLFYGSYSINIKDLIHNRTYYHRAYAITREGTIYGDTLSFSTPTEAVIDVDGNSYSAVQIGTQVWMAENLRTSKYPDGTAIPHITADYYWNALSDNNKDDAYRSAFVPSTNNIGYGYLYTYAAALSACPTGWHLPSDAEWKTLEMYIGLSEDEADDKSSRGTDEGAKLKTTSGWLDNNGNGTDDYGFSALPSGGCTDLSKDKVDYQGFGAYWWSSTQANSSNAYYRGVGSYGSSVLRNTYNKSNGYSVRCVRD